MTDILIVGAGPVGAHAAHLFAERGFKVVLLEKNKREACGARWVNGVPLWQLEDAGLQKPPPNEIHHSGNLFSIISPLSQHRITLNDAQLLDIDMRHFGLRLLSKAESHPNVTTYFETTFHHLNFDVRNRPNSAHTSAGEINFKLIIDASGMSAVIRKQVPILSRLCPQVTPADICTAAQEVYEIADPHGAHTYLERNNGTKGEALAFVGIAGGFSLMRVIIDQDARHVAFLTGSRPLPGIPSGMDLIRQFVADNVWVGARMFGGQRPIPLRRPYAALSASGVALLGDAGSQIYSAHGSGIGISLIAAKILAETLKSASDKDEDISDAEVLARYARRFHKLYGSLLANSDASRRFSQSLTQEETHTLIERRLLSPNIARDALFQRPIGFYLADIPGQIVKAMQHPRLVGKVLKVAAKMPLIAAAMKTYPRTADPEKLLRFDQRLEKLVR